MYNNNKCIKQNNTFIPIVPPKFSKIFPLTFPIIKVQWGPGISGSTIGSAGGRREGNKTLSTATEPPFSAAVFAMALDDESVVYNVTEYLATGYYPSGSSKSDKACIRKRAKQFDSWMEHKGNLPQGNLNIGKFTPGKSEHKGNLPQGNLNIRKIYPRGMCSWRQFTPGLFARGGSFP